MRRIISPAAVFLAAKLPGIAAVDYITDHPLFSSLAPCAQSAVSYHVQRQTQDSCPEDATQLQSCVCTKNDNYASITRMVSSSISRSCGSAATDDQTSAATVLSAYCNPDSTYTFPPLPPISEYITDRPEFNYLAPCAGTALKQAVAYFSREHCGAEPAELASCVCKKNDLSHSITQKVASTAKVSCNKHMDDVTSAQQMFAAYCAMVDGTTSFPEPPLPPGDVTYWITDLPQYSSLAPCAQYGLRWGALHQTYEYCPSGPQFLASCLCFKSGMPSEVLSTITASVKYSCSSTALEDVASAVEVYDYFCSAVEAKVTPDVKVSVAQDNLPTSGSRNSGPKQTGGSGSSGSNDEDKSEDGGQSNNSGDNSSSSKVGIGTIVGAFAGVLVAIAVGIFAFWFIRKKRKGAGAKQPLLDNNQSFDPVGGKYELPADSVPITALKPPPSPTPSPLSPNVSSRMDNNGSPVSSHHLGAGITPPPPHSPYGVAELQGETPVPSSSPHPSVAELYGQGSPHPNRPELDGGYYAPQMSPVPASLHPGYQPGAPQQGWQSGPMPMYYEMNAGRDGVRPS